MIALSNTVSYQHASLRWLWALLVTGLAITALLPVFRFQPDGHRYRKTSRRIFWLFVSTGLAVLAWLILFGDVSYHGSDALQAPQSWLDGITMATSAIILILPVAVVGIGLLVLVEWRTVKPQRRRRRSANRLSVVVLNDSQDQR